MELSVPNELEELILCSCCHLPFNDTDAIPKMFTCRHYFCLKCVNAILQKRSELYCVHCWKRTELPGPDMKPDNLPTYGAILYLTKNLKMLSMKLKSPCEKQRSSSSTSSVNSNNGGNSNSTTADGNCGNKNSSSEPAVVQNTPKIKGENCMTHAMPNTLWCTKCAMMVCRACAASEDHKHHVVKTYFEAKETIQSDISNELFSMQKTLNDVQQLVLRQRDFLLNILESCTALKTQIETELINHLPTLEIADMRESLCKAKICLDMLDKQTPAEALKLFTTLHMEKQRLSSRYQEIFLQCKLDDLIRNYGMVFDFDVIKKALVQLHNCVINGSPLDSLGNSNATATHHNPVLLLANYCISQLYSRHILVMKHQQYLLTTGSTGYFQFSQHSRQPTAIPPQASLSNESSPNDAHVQVRSYADITTNSPKSNRSQQHTISSSTMNEFGNPQAASLGPVGPGSARMPDPSPSNDYNSSPVTTLSKINQGQQNKHSSRVQAFTGPQQQANTTANLLCNPSVRVYPIYYLNIEMNGQAIGQILIEVRNDVAPKMAKNFGALATHELGFGYKGCQIFQCWEKESIITGDFELNNGRGGRSVFEENYFMPDDTKILAIRGSVGMRRSQKRHDNMGLVGSQFRVILREMRGFTGIFAFVVDGLELIEKISQVGDSAGKPQSSVVIQNCGKYQ